MARKVQQQATRIEMTNYSLCGSCSDGWLFDAAAEEEKVADIIKLQMVRWNEMAATCHMSLQVTAFSRFQESVCPGR
jgi:hypothetical protein